MKSKQAASPPESPKEPLSPLLPLPLFYGLTALWTVYSVYENLSLAKPFFGSIAGLAELPGTLPGVLAEGLWLRLLIITAFWATAAGTGRLLLRPLNLAVTGLEEKLICGAVGSAAIILLALAAAALGLWNPAALRALCVLLFSLGMLGLWLPGSATPTPPVAPLSVFDRVAGIFLLAAASSAMLTTAAPELFYDSLVYHLALPKLYLLSGGLVPTPHNVFSGAPQGAQMLYGLMLSLGDFRLTALLHLSFGLATALLLWTSCRVLLGSGAGLFAATIFLCCPVVLYSGTSSGVDLFSAFFVLAAFHSMARSLDAEGHGWALCGGVALGAALSTKYNVFAVSLALVLTHFITAWRRGKPLTGPLILAAISFIVLSPWIVKNLLFFGKPLYPFLSGQPLPDWAGFLSAAESQDLKATFTTLPGLKRFFAVPWNNFSGQVAMDNWPGAAFLILAPWLLVRGDDRVHRPAILAALLASLSWALTSTQGRFLIPVLPLLSFALASALLRTRVPAWLRGAGLIALLAASTVNLAAASHQNLLSRRWAFLKAPQDEAAFLRTEAAGYPIPSYDAIAFINKNLPSDAKVLFLGDSRAAHMERRFIAPTVFDANPLWTAVASARDAAGIRDALVASGVTHILLNGRGLYMGSPKALLPAEAVSSKRFDEFCMHYLKPVFEDSDDGAGTARWLFVYEILPARSPKPLQRFNIPREVLRTIQGL